MSWYLDNLIIWYPNILMSWCPDNLISWYPDNLNPVILISWYPDILKTWFSALQHQLIPTINSQAHPHISLPVHHHSVATQRIHSIPWERQTPHGDATRSFLSLRPPRLVSPKPNEDVWSAQRAQRWVQTLIKLLFSGLDEVFWGKNRLWQTAELRLGVCGVVWNTEGFLL